MKIGEILTPAAVTNLSGSIPGLIAKWTAIQTDWHVSHRSATDRQIFASISLTRVHLQ